MDAVIDHATEGQAPPSDRQQIKRLSIHGVALLVLLLALITLSNGSLAVPDEGVYLAQASNLVDGGWASDAPAVDIDESGLFTPVAEGGARDGKVVPYAKHPLYPVVLTPAFALGGYVGALVMSIMGTWAAALSAAFIARRIRPSYGPWALWIVGLGSPLLFDSYIAVAHSIAAAAAGAAFLGLSRAVDSRRWMDLWYALPAVAVLVALRSEGLIFAVALGLTIGAVALGWPPFRKIDWTAGVVGAGTLGIAASTYLVDLRLARIIRGGSTNANPASRLSSESVDLMGGIWASLLRPFASTWLDVQVFVPLAVICVLLAALALKIRPTFTLLPIGLLVMAAVAALGSLTTDPQLITGLIPAFPLLTAGLLLLRWSSLRDSLVSRALAVALLTTAAIVVANYGIGGASEWGGRFFHLLIPILVPIALIGLDRGRAAMGPRETRVAGTCLLVVTTVISFTAVRTLVTLREGTEDIVTSSISRAESLSDGQSKPLIITAYPNGSGASRYYWGQLDQVDVLSAGDLRQLGALVGAADGAGRSQVTLVTNARTEALQMVLAPVLASLGWSIIHASPSPKGWANIVTIGESPSN